LRQDVKDLAAQVARLQWFAHETLRVLLRTEGEVLMAYEQELADAEAEAKANSDQEDSAASVLKVLADLVASLKTGQTDPATAKRITDLTAAIRAGKEKLAAAIAATPTE
jgi:hypothetical protein